MLRHRLIAGLVCAAQALALAAVLPAWAQTPPAPDRKPVADSVAASQPGLPERSPVSPSRPAADASAVGTTAEPPAAALEPAAPADPVMTIIRVKLADPGLREEAEADDIAALQAFYGARAAPPLWMTDMGFSTRAQAALFEIEKADDWGLDKSAFALPAAGALPKSAEEQAAAEVALDLAILKYARHARGGRFKPAEVSELFDQEPQLRDPRTVLAEIEAADAPDAYLRSLHPRHEHFARLRQTLLEARGQTADEPKPDAPKADDSKPDSKPAAKADDSKPDSKPAAKTDDAQPEAKSGTKPDTPDKPKASATDIKRIVLNMERWRWLPEDLGPIYVWLNTPEFMLYLVKDGKTVFTDKTQVGTIGNATPIFSADMETVVFNPEWIAPRSVLTETLLPPLRKKNYAFLKKHRISVSYGGKPVNAARVKWTSANIHNYTFIQAPGPGNNLGKIKFLYPNEHDVYMHDTLPVRKKMFNKAARAIGYGCVRMEKPQEFAELILAGDQDLPKAKVKELWDKSVNEPITLKSPIPVHTTYFTAVVDDKGKVETFADLYGLDRKLAIAMFGAPDGFPVPPPDVKKRRALGTSASFQTRSGSSLAGALQDFLGD